MPTRPVNIRIDTELYDYLEARAEKEHRTLSNMIISILLDAKESMKSENMWIPCSDKLPETICPVIITWKNNDPAPYYQHIVGEHYAGIAHFKNGKWYWYSSVTEDVLAEYGRCDSEEFDKAIQVLAWMPLPEPYKLK